MNYNFYIQRFPRRVWDDQTQNYIVIAGDTSEIDIEQRFKCKYVKMEGIGENGKAKNIYTENFAEAEALRLYVPKTVIYENTNLSLTLLFLAENGDQMDIQTNEREFFEFVSGRPLEYNDTFRKRYVSMILINKPEVVGEVLYGDTRYRQIKYTFKNIYGRSFAVSCFDNKEIYKPFVLDSSILDDIFTLL